MKTTFIATVLENICQTIVFMNRMNIMEHVHLAAEDEDDLYGGFNEHNPLLDTDALAYDHAFQQAVRTSYGRRPPPTRARMGPTAGSKGMPPSSLGARPITGLQDGAGARPMTAVRAAGYTSAGIRAGGDASQLSRGPAPPLEQKNDNIPEEKIKQLERRVNELIDESCMAEAKGEYQLALEKAKEAGRKERVLVREKEKISSNEQMNLDLTYSVLFNLANQYANNEMLNEALNTYQVIVKNKMFTNAGRLKVNIGNLFFKQRQFAKAVKFYRMALDQVPILYRSMRIRIMQNIGISFVKLGQYDDAITSFEHIMTEEANFRTGFNLILCYFAAGNREKMKKTFQRLLTVDLRNTDDEKYLTALDDKQHTLIMEVIKNDSLRQIERKKKSEAEQCIMLAAKIIAPAIEPTYNDGYEWCIEQVKASQYMELAHSLDIDKAIGFLKRKDFQQAVETLKSFEKKDSKVAAAAATNLSFLYILEGERTQADKYADIALTADRYNPSALVNKGNVAYNKGDYEKAREFYRDALSNDSSCIEALYNFGLCNKQLRRYEEALDSFYKLHAIARNNAQVFYQLADIYDILGDQVQSKEWFLQLLGVTPTDATVLQRLGEMYDAEQDKPQAFQYHLDAYKYDPTNLSVIEWLGAYYIETQFAEKAVQYFERAALIQPTEVKWQLMVASCHRRSGNYQNALDTYKSIHRRFPDNIECLKFLIRLCTDMNLKEVEEYVEKLKRAEKTQKQRETSAGHQRGALRRTDRQTSASSTGDRLYSGGRREHISTTQQHDDNYSDPLGPQAERPRTAARRRDQPVDEFANTDIGEDLLPD